MALVLHHAKPIAQWSARLSAAHETTVRRTYKFCLRATDSGVMLLERWPMSAIDITSYSLWYLGTALEAIAVTVMMRRRLIQEFPVFFSYLAFHVIYAFLGFFVRAHYGG